MIFAGRRKDSSIEMNFVRTHSQLKAMVDLEDNDN